MKAATAHQLEHLYRDHHEALTAYLNSRCHDAVLVADVVQDTYLKLYAFLTAGKELTNPKSWLFRVAQNMLFDHYRKNGTTVHLPDQELVATEQTDRHGPEDCLLGIIAGLPMKYKRAVYLVDVKGMRQTEAAQKLDLALPTFKSHVQRGRKLVKQGYVDCCNYTINEQGHLEGEVKKWHECKVCRH